MLLAVYGLRAGEVAALRLEDFDWEREVLTIPTANRRGRGFTRCVVRSATPFSATCGRCAPGQIGGRCSSRCGHRSGR